MANKAEEAMTDTIPQMMKKLEAQHMALRDQFAMAALTGLLTHMEWADCAYEDASKESYEFADAMLAARKPQ